MSRLACVMLLVVLWSGPYLLIHHASESAATLRQPEQQVPQAQFGGMYRRMLWDNPSTLDPTFLTDTYGRAVVSQIFDGLVQLDAELNPMPAIAEFWEASGDGRTWTFTLRRGVRFHHGREVTAHDFVYSFSRFLKPPKSVPLTEFFRRIQGAEDFTTPTSLARTFVQSIRAPRKAFVTIPEGGHFAVFMKRDAFLHELVARLLPAIGVRGSSRTAGSTRRL